MPSFYLGDWRMIKTKIIDLYGEPCAGKSTLAAGLFYRMKRQYMSVELVTEYAKDLIYEGHESGSMDQIEVFAEQHRRVARLIGKVDYVITDSPLRLSAYYAGETNFRKVILDKAAGFDTLNFYVNRNHPYDQNGRTQDETGAAKVKLELREFLKENNIWYKDVTAGDELPGWMYHGLFVDGDLLKEQSK